MSLSVIGLGWGKIRRSRPASTAAIAPLLGTVVVGGLVLPGAAAAAPTPACAGGSCLTSFPFVGAAAQAWTVPVGVESAAFTVDGAAGGRGAATTGNTPAPGGLGSGVAATLSLTPARP